MSDGFDLQRFVDAQDSGGSYDGALAELRRGHKRTHWMWYVFPQLEGLGFSAMAQRYGITGAAEARAYLAHPVLGPRLLACVRALLAQPESDPVRIFGGVDAQKLCSCLTLFASIEGAGQADLTAALDRFCAGRADPTTVARLAP